MVLADPTVLIPVKLKIACPVDVVTPESDAANEPPANLMVFETPLSVTAVQVLAVPVLFTITAKVIEWSSKSLDVGIPTTFTVMSPLGLVVYPTLELDEEL